MDENSRLSGQFSLKSAFVVTLIVCVGLGLIRVQFSLAALYFGIALALLVHYFIGRASKEGFFWAMMLLVVLGGIGIFLANGL